MPLLSQIQLIHCKALSSSSSSSSSCSITDSWKRKMCNRAPEWIPPRTLVSDTRKQRSKRSKVRVHRLNRRKRACEEEVGKDMELKNLKLYMENMSILEENEKLRKKASLLHQENVALMSEFQKKFSHFDRLSTILLLLENTTIK